MAHFAKIENGIVTQVIVLSDEHETDGQEFINNKLKLDGTWLQTSYNTQAGVHINGGTPLRKNFAGIGFTYDADLDAFIAPKPFDSWRLDVEKCTWEPPVEYPTDGQNYTWNETTLSWELVETEEN